jgi:hypothetical protein
MPESKTENDAGRQTLSTAAQSAAFHWAADETNDAHDHDELHAAGAIVGSSAYVDLFDVEYVARWLDGLWARGTRDIPPGPGREEATDVAM